MKKDKGLKSFELSSKFYNEIYSDKNTESEVDYLLNLSSKFGSSSKYILDFGCGTGRHSRLFFEKGRNVIGIDKSSQMIENAPLKKDNNKDISMLLRNQDISDLSSDYFDTVFALFHVFSYQTTDKEIYHLLENVWRVLKKNGLFIFDIWYSPAVCYQLPSKRTKCVTTKNGSKIKRVCNPSEDIDNSIVDVEYTFSINSMKSNSEIKIENHRLRHFTSNEIRILSKQFKFNFIHNEEWMSGLIPSRDSWGVVYILQK